jgi:hypothetical protein
MWSNRSCGIQNEGEIGLAMIIQRSGYANKNGFHFGQSGGIGGGFQSIGIDLLGNAFRREMLQISFSCIDRIDLLLIEIEPKNRNPGSGELQGQGKADIAKSNN